MAEQYAVIDGEDGVVYVGDYREAVEWYKTYCDRAFDDAMDECGESFEEQFTVRIAKVIVVAQPVDLPDAAPNSWRWHQEEPTLESTYVHRVRHTINACHQKRTRLIGRPKFERTTIYGGGMVIDSILKPVSGREYMRRWR